MSKIIPEYRSWLHMRQRCLNPNNRDYRDYGGRGIKICKRWMESFLNFYEDMGPKPLCNTRYSLGRINVNGNYTKKNCQWETDDQQANNKRNNLFFKYRGKLRTISEIANAHNMDRELLRGRLKNGWSVKKAVTTPIHPTIGRACKNHD